MKKLVIFDLDGTLLYSLEDLADATNFALKKNGFAEHELDKYRYFVGNGVRVLVERALPGGESDVVVEKVLSDFRDYYSKHSDDKSNVYDGIDDMVKELHESGIKLAVASNKPDEFTKVLIDELFGGMFDYVQGSTAELKPKPSADMPLKILSELGINAEDAVFVGDTNIDINTGKAAGIETVGCLWGYRTLAELESAGADNIISKPCELLDIIR